MKKFYLFAAVAAFGFVACTKAEVSDQPEMGQEFSIFAEITKTSNDGVSTEWVADDAISVFHADEDSVTYSSNDKFTISEAGLASGQFTGTLTEELEDCNDWYAIYPYKAGLTAPTGTGSGHYFHLGAFNSYTNAQVQKGNSSMAHLAGTSFPMWAQAKGVDEESPVSLTFNQIVSVVKFNVTNNTTQPLTVQSVSVTSDQEDIIGSYYINFAGESPVLTKSGDKYVSQTAKLTVSDGEAIAAGESAEFYLAIKPFASLSGSKLTFSVNGYEKSTTAAYTFSSGSIKQINFNYDKEPKIFKDGAYVALILNSGTSYFAMTSTDDGKSTKRFKSMDVTYDGSATFKTSDASIVWNIAKSDTCSSYLFENGGKYISWTSGNSAVMSADPYLLDLVENGDNYKIKSNAESSRILSKNASSAFFAFYGNELQKVDFVLVPAELSTTPVINPIDDPAKVGAEGATGVEVSYTITNPVAGKSVSAVSAETWVSNFNYDTEGKIIFDVAENTDADDRSSEVTVSYEGAEDVKFTVTQAAAGTTDPIILDMTTKKYGNSAYNSSLAYGDWTIVNGANNNKGWAYFKMGGKETTLAEANPCYIYYNNKVAVEISEITVNIVAGSFPKTGMSVNSWGVYVYSDAEMETEVDYVAGGTITSAAANFSFKPSEGKTWKDCYVKVSWDLANTTTTNGIVWVDNVTVNF